MPRVIKHDEAHVSTARLPGGHARFAAYLTGQDFRSAVRGFGVRSLDPGVHLDPADIGPVEEVWLVISGVGVVLTDHGDLPIQPGDVVFSMAGERRGLRNTGMEPLVFAGFAADVKP